MATLNPGRTRGEYEKAVRYFFETPGVPEALVELTFDLLLAYRGALALRATNPRDRRGQSRPPVHPSAGPALDTGASRQLPEEQEEEQGTDDSATQPPDSPDQAEAAPRPLAPATVNIRLTALRQFLCHCALSGTLPQLTPDQIRAALRRLHIERRRPYQILAEPEWAQFLLAAQAPMAHTQQAHDPWGIPHAHRGQDLTRQEHSAATDLPPMRRSRAGLTGARTAQRDHALISLALATGLRAVEISELDVGDLAREWHAGSEEWWLILPDAKTKGQRGGRTLPLAPDLIDSLQAYLRATGRAWERPGDRATPLFLSAGRRRPKPGAAQDGKTQSQREFQARRLSPGDIGRIVDRVETQWLAMRGAVATGDEDEPDETTLGDQRAISPHALRHSTAVALLEGNATTGRPPASVEHVRGWLGHFDIRTTQGYLAHLEARRHRRPFALSPVTPPAPGPAQPPQDEPPRSAGGPGSG
jgi:integrase